jgi:hypothetical protein
MVTIWTKRGQPEDDSWDCPFCYVVTDVETDGPEPGQNSMRSFASVAMDHTGTFIDQFEGCLAPLDGAAPDPGTLAWLQSQPEVWEDATRNPTQPRTVMVDYVAWLRALSMQAVFVANPLTFDGLWVDWYLRRFVNCRLLCGPYGGKRLFLGAGIDLPSLVMGTTGWSYAQCRRERYPLSWLDGHRHTHRAIDDAMGYANVLKELLRLKAVLPGVAGG